jgi:hypothetical protein
MQKEFPVTIPTLYDSRCGQLPVPKNFTDYLTPKQEVALFGLNKLGWRLNFIRRPHHQEPTIVLKSRHDDHVVSVLDRDGHINTAPALALRR